MNPIDSQEREVDDLDQFKPKAGYAIMGVAAVVVVLLLVGIFVWSASHESSDAGPIRPGSGPSTPRVERPGLDVLLEALRRAEPDARVGRP